MDCYSSGEDYNSRFDTSWYLRTFYGADSHLLKEGCEMQRLCELFAKLDPVENGKLLQFGCGPSLVHAIVASRVFSSITMAEYAEPNRNAIENWIHKTSEAFDWSHFFSYTATFEELGTDIIENRTRDAIEEIIPCDIHSETILPSHKSDKEDFDFVISTLCLEPACSDLAAYDQAMVKLCRLIKPGGRLYLHGTVGLSFYKVKDCKFFSLPVTEEDIIKAVTLAGMKVDSFERTQVKGIKQYDHDQFYYLLATKQT